jgi:hypothetical protein
MAKYISQPKEVEAFQWFESGGVNPGNAVKHELVDLGRAEFCVTTIHGQKTIVRDGDYIVTEPDGIHHYPVKPDIFEANYKLIEEKEDIFEQTAGSSVQ